MCVYMWDIPSSSATFNVYTVFFSSFEVISTVAPFHTGFYFIWGNFYDWTHFTLGVILNTSGKSSLWRMEIAITIYTSGKIVTLIVTFGLQACNYGLNWFRWCCYA